MKKCIMTSTMLVALALVGGMKPSDPAGDERAVRVLREMSDLARDSGSQLLLYPNVGNWIERIEDAVAWPRKSIVPTSA